MNQDLGPIGTVSHEEKISVLKNLRWDVCLLHFIFFLWGVQAALKIGAGQGTVMSYFVVVFVLINLFCLYNTLGRVKRFILEEKARIDIEEIIKNMLANGELTAMSEAAEVVLDKASKAKVVTFPTGEAAADQPCEECDGTCEKCESTSTKQ